MDGNAEVIGAYAWAHEMSSGKDTRLVTGKSPVSRFCLSGGYFSDHENSFPQELLDKLVERANLPGYLGNRHSSGTVILINWRRHMKTGKPISIPPLTPCSRLPATKKPLVWINSTNCAKSPVKS